MNQEFNGPQLVEFVDINSMTRVSFTWDFTGSTPLDLRGISVVKEATVSNAGFVIVNGVPPLPNGLKKTITLNNNVGATNGVCVKDVAGLASISEITASCTGASEVLVACNSVPVSGYTCSVVSGGFQVSGLTNSGVEEQNATSTPTPTPTPTPSPTFSPTATPCPGDIDCDGVLDLVDSLIGNPSTIPTSGFTSLGITVEGDANVNQQFTGVQSILLTDSGSSTRVLFDWDFDSAALDLSGVNISKESSGQAGFVIVQGISLPLGVTKSVSLNNNNPSSNGFA